MEVRVADVSGNRRMESGESFRVKRAGVKYMGM